MPDVEPAALRTFVDVEPVLASHACPVFAGHFAECVACLGFGDVLAFGGGAVGGACVVGG